MTIGAGSVVALRNYSDDLAVGAIPLTWMPPMFGVANAAVVDGAVTINWGDGNKESVADTSIDEIVDATDTNFIGHIVAVVGQNGSARFTVFAEYQRGTDEGAQEFVLGMTETGIWRELAVSAVELVQ